MLVGMVTGIGVFFVLKQRQIIDLKKRFWMKLNENCIVSI